MLEAEAQALGHSDDGRRGPAQRLPAVDRGDRARQWRTWADQGRGSPQREKDAVECYHIWKMEKACSEASPKLAWTHGAASPELTCSWRSDSSLDRAGVGPLYAHLAQGRPLILKGSHITGRTATAHPALGTGARSRAEPRASAPSSALPEEAGLSHHHL
ncbi:unnamed protein product [Rangifer tarandus platyrhynchus]|uniref:Uncharacterized protein n=1 Tax=Rangifer tarandus platyrhynchus TaxID=3082113 RepID=A0ABN8Y2T2_RANTA|nr:unnamed protein product [Rangifer tarandus platyrhynchus]